MRHEWEATVLSVTEHKVKKYVSGVGDAAVFEEVSAGWFVRVSESSAIGVGMTKPDLEPGDTVGLTMFKKVRPVGKDPNLAAPYGRRDTVTARTRDEEAALAGRPNKLRPPP